MLVLTRRVLGKQSTTFNHRHLWLPTYKPAPSSYRFLRIHSQVERSNPPPTELIDGAEYRRYSVELNPGLELDDVLQGIQFPPSSTAKILSKWDRYEGSDHFAGFVGKPPVD